MNLFKLFTNLPTYIKRSLIIGSVILPLIIAVIYDDRNEFEEEFFYTIIISFVIYWLLTIAGLWIYEGFIKDKKKDIFNHETK